MTMGLCARIVVAPDEGAVNARLMKELSVADAQNRRRVAGV
jgi:hypothetical protein